MGFIWNPKPLKSETVIGQKPCPMCKGHGYIIYSKASSTSANAQVTQLHITCPSCGGLGYIYEFTVTAGLKDDTEAG